MSLIDGMINQTIDTISSVSRNAYGKETLTTVYSDVPCRWQESTVRSHTILAEKLDYDITVWLLPTYNILSSYIVTKDSQDYKIVKIRKHHALSGELDHISLLLK
jgi:hypothetical protein